MSEALDRMIAWDRSGWFGDGLRTYPVGLGVLVVGALLIWVENRLEIPAGTLLFGAVTAVAVVGLAQLGRLVAHRVLVRRGQLVDRRRAAATTTLRVYAGLAVAVAVGAGGLDAYPLVMGALAMTSPGVFLVVMDGSPPRRAALRVLLATLLVPIAAMVGYFVGFAAYFVSTIIGSFVFGFLAGHLVTFVPLALLGPGPDRLRPSEGDRVSAGRAPLRDSRSPETGPRRTERA